MVLLRKKIDNTNTYFDFEKIVESGYQLKEDTDRITQKFVNGNRKQFVSNYTDVIITINLAPFDLETLVTYLEQLTNGEYQYFSYKDNTYKNAIFIIDEIPPIVTNRTVDNDCIIDDFSIKLLKAGDVNA